VSLPASPRINTDQVTPVASVALNPDTTQTIVAGNALQLTATPRDSANGDLTGCAGLVWKTSDSTIATVSVSGLVSAVAAGNVTITVASATNPAVTASVSVVVTGSPLRTVLATGNVHSCALGPAGQAYCWGMYLAGPIGSSVVPVAVQQGSLSFTSLASSYGETACALTGTGAPYCWGANNFGQLGAGTAAGSSTPLLVQGGLTFVQLVAAPTYACGLSAAGQAYCWGTDSLGALGVGSTMSSPAPLPVQQGAVRFAMLAASGDHSCALTPAGQAYCWGDNRSGQLGTGSPSSVPVTTPVPVAQGSLVFKTIGIGYVGRPELPGAENTCALTTSGQAYCWGDNSYGELGVGPVSGPVASPTFGGISAVPVAVQGGHTFSSLAVGDGFSCGLDSTGQALCWGFDRWGQLGRGSAAGDFRPNPIPALVEQGGVAYSVISGGNNFTCALSTTGAGYCWGEGDRGQFGNGTLTATSAVPLPVSGGLTFVTRNSHRPPLTANRRR